MQDDILTELKAKLDRLQRVYEGHQASEKLLSQIYFRKGQIDAIWQVKAIIKVLEDGNEKV